LRVAQNSPAYRVLSFFNREINGRGGSWRRGGNMVAAPPVMRSPRVLISFIIR
jgi:hypothetical protein